MSHVNVRVQAGAPEPSGHTGRGALDPPPLSVGEVTDDIRWLWKREYSGERLSRKLAFSGLRAIQHAAYRLGYGPGWVGAQVPSPCRPNFRCMERNLQEIRPEMRLDWVHAFLGCVNDSQGHAEVPPPRSIVLEFTNTCNLNCLDCGIGARGVDPSRSMTPANLRKWAEATSGKAESIRINGLGEATLSPHLDKCLEILGAFPGGREIITNFTAPLDLYARMLQVGFVILVSWDGCSAPVFEAIRRGADFGTLCQKLPRLAEHAAAIGAPDPVILFTLRPQNLHELPGTVDLVSRLGIRHMIVNTLRVRDGLDWTGPYRSNIQCVLALAAETATVRCVNLVLPDHVGGEPVRGPYVHRCSTDGCRFPFTEVVVRWDGEVTPCNMMNPYSYGHIAAHGFDACWNGPEARAFRRLANTAKRHPHCDGCCYVNFRRSRRA